MLVLCRDKLLLLHLLIRKNNIFLHLFKRFFMGNIATDFAQQIEKLASRGMKFDLKEDKIKEHLLDIGYYRLGFYWCPFTDKNHNFN